MTAEQEQLDLLIVDQLVQPIDTALAVLVDAQEDLASQDLRPVTLSALYALAVSQLEIAVAETLLYTLRRNPWRMDFERIEVTRDSLISAELVRELLESRAEEKVRKWSYGRQDDLLRRFLCVTDLPKQTASGHLVALGKLRERRNEILHRSPAHAGRDGEAGRWPSHADTQQCVECVRAFLAEVREALALRYASHTHVAALRRLWSHLFTSPMMQFDDYWIIEADHDRVLGRREDAPIGNLASSERVLLGLWLAEFCGDASLLREFSMKSLGPQRRRDLVTLIASLRDVWVY